VQKGPSIQPRPAPRASAEAEYDALADLFLGEGLGSSPADVAGSAQPRRPAPPRKVAPAPTSPPALVLRSDAGVTAATPVTRAEPSAPVEPAPSLVVEALLQAHLPIMASAWVTQYAKHAASSGAGVALLRIRAGTVSLELFGAAAIEKLPSGPVSSLTDAIWRATLVASRWMFHVDETREPEFLQLSGLSAITVLSGADEPALVACYRTIKGVTIELRESGESPMPRVQVAFLGAAAERSTAASRTLQRTASTFLGVELGVAAVVEKIGPCPSVTVYRAPEPDSKIALAELLSGVTCAFALGSSTPAESGSLQINSGTSARSGSSEPLSPATLAAMELNAEDEDELDLLPPLAMLPLSKQAKGARPDAAPDARLEPKPAQKRAPLFGPGGPPTGLMSQVVGELRALEVKCPYASDVELAIGPDGRLHLLAHTSASKGADSGRAMEQLTAASSWAVDHALLLKAVGVSGRLDEVNRPVAHLLTDKPRDVRRLLDSEVRVHVLAKADVGDGWICRALN
jgi:hypothetical protein